MGPLTGFKIIEFEGLGPAPFTGMMLADMGAEVISIGRQRGGDSRSTQISERGKRSIALNLKSAEGKDIALKLIESADALTEGFRPGVMERLGLGPEECLERNPRLVYGRMTGWGQSGPLAQAAGHDINYIALAGALHGIGRAGEKPVPPVNLVGDFGGGGMYLAFGLVCGILEAQRSGKGQVVDAAMVDGVASLMHFQHMLVAQDAWQDQCGTNFLDGGAHYYDTYETRDGKYISIGSLEPQFYDQLMQKLGLEGAEIAAQRCSYFGKSAEDPARWPELSEQLETIFKSKTRDEWCQLLEGTDVCFAPVLSMAEAPLHPHNQARGNYLTLDGILQPAPSPRFSRTSPEVAFIPQPAGSDTDKVLAELGYGQDAIEKLQSDGVVR